MERVEFWIEILATDDHIGPFGSYNEACEVAQEYSRNHGLVAVHKGTGVKGPKRLFKNGEVYL